MKKDLPFDLSPSSHGNLSGTKQNLIIMQEHLPYRENGNGNYAGRNFLNSCRNSVMSCLFLLLGFLLFSSGLYSQASRTGNFAKDIRNRVAVAKSNGAAFQIVKLFDASTRSNAQDFTVAVGKGVTFDLDQQLTTAFINNKYEALTLEIPGAPGQNSMMVELISSTVVTSSFKVFTSGNPGVPAQYQGGLHYQGIVAGNQESLVAISVFNDRVMGLISTSNGTYNLGKVDGPGNKHILYLDADLKKRSPFSCGTVDDGLGYKIKELGNNNLLNACPVRIYVEVDKSVYDGFAGNLTNTSNFVTGLFNQSFVIYANENINMVMSEMFIWTTPDPYSGTTTGQFLSQFQAHTGAFNGDLGHLIALQNIGGVAAGFAGLCNADRDQSLCFSGLNVLAFSNVPVYSFPVFIISHEMGHLVGSRHTHACVWNGNNTAIDGCSGFVEGSCALPGSPAAGGTIMSYCHNDPVGINFNLGFGPQPGNVIRNSVTNAACLSVGCNPAGCTFTSSFGSAAIPANNTLVTISTCSFAGEYSTITGAVSGQTLRFTSSVATDFITIHSGTPSGPIIATGQTPLTFANTFTGTLYAHWSTNAACGTQSTCRTTTVQCTSCPSPAPANDLCTGAITINCGQTLTGTTIGATIDAVPTCNTTLNTAGGVWYTFVGNGQITTLNTCTGTAYDSKIGVFSGTCTALTCVTGNDDFCALQSQVTFTAATGTTYYVLVTGFGTSTGAFSLSRTCLTPTIVATGTLLPFTTCAGTPSAEQTFTVSGTGLVANLVVTAPAGYEVSTTSGSGFSGSVSFTPTAGGTVTAQTIYIRLAAQTAGTPSGNVACTSTGATTQNVAVSGTVIALPVVNAPTVTQPTCTRSTGTIVVNATGTGVLEYRLNAGAFQLSNTFSGLVPGNYNIFVRSQSNPTCIASYSGNPVVIVPAVVITCPANIIKASDYWGCGANVTYPPATATGNCGPLTYSKASGSWFDVGITVITVSSPSGASCTFTVHVKDMTNPYVTNMSKDIYINAAPNTCSRVVTFPVTAGDNCPGVTAAAVPPSGSIFSVGTTTVIITATDAAGNIGTHSFKVTVDDRQLPVITCPPNVTVGTEPGICKAHVTLTPATATDNCPGVVVTAFRNDFKALGDYYLPGTTTVTWRATDASGNYRECNQKVTVKDMEEPVITNVVINPQVLWPPDHTMRIINVDYNMSDNCGQPTSTLSVTSNEPICCTGPGDLSPDWQILDRYTVKLRAERADNGTGRIYTIRITVKDAAGNTKIHNAYVYVPLTNTSLVESITSNTNAPKVPNTAFSAQLIPNPTQSVFNLLVKGNTNEAVEIRVFDLSGRVLQTMRTAANDAIRFGDDLFKGTYMIEVKQGKNKVVLKGIKL